MSTLVVSKIDSTEETVVLLSGSSRLHIGAFIPYIYMHGAPAGTFTFSLIKSAVTLFSQTFTCADIQTSLGTSDTYARVYYPIVPTNPVAIEAGTYTLKISSSGYTASETSYLGWIRRYEEQRPTASYTPATDMENPLAYKIKVYSV